MTPLFVLYAGLAVAGAILPYALFLPWLAAHGFAPRLFVAELFATGPATVFAADVLLASIVFLIFVFVEGRRLGMRHLWVQPVVTYTIGRCCALPLFLALRERRRAGR